MNNTLPSWLWRWLCLPGWQIFATQWLGLGAVALVSAGWLLQDEWRQRGRVTVQRQYLLLQIEQRELQLALMPSNETLMLRLQQETRSPIEQSELTETLPLAGATLLRWQRLEKPPRQILSLRIGYAGLLTLLKALPPALRIEQINLEAQLQDMSVRFVLQDIVGDSVDE